MLVCIKINSMNMATHENILFAHQSDYHLAHASSYHVDQIIYMYVCDLFGLFIELQHITILH